MMPEVCKSWAKSMPNDILAKASTGWHGLHFLYQDAAREELRQRNSVAMGYGWSYTEYLNGQTQQSEVEASKPREKECRCDSHYLFAFGHEKQCDHYKEKK